MTQKRTSGDLYFFLYIYIFMYCTCIQLCDLEVIYGSCVNSSGIMASMYDLNVSYSGKLLAQNF